MTTMLRNGRSSKHITQSYKKNNKSGKSHSKHDIQRFADLPRVKCACFIDKNNTEWKWHLMEGCQEEASASLAEPNCLHFAREHLDNLKSLCKSILWTNGSKIDQNDSAYHRKNHIPTVRHAGNFQICGCFYSSGPGQLHIIKGTINSKVGTAMEWYPVHVAPSSLGQAPGFPANQ